MRLRGGKELDSLCEHQRVFDIKIEPKDNAIQRHVELFGHMHDGSKRSSNREYTKRTVTGSLACMVAMQHHGMGCNFRSIVKGPRTNDTIYLRQQQKREAGNPSFLRDCVCWSCMLVLIELLVSNIINKVAAQMYGGRRLTLRQNQRVFFFFWGELLILETKLLKLLSKLPP